MIRGRVIIAMVNAPERRESPQPSTVTKKIAPNRPYTIEGIPDSVSAVILTISTSLLPLFAYSTR